MLLFLHGSHVQSYIYWCCHSMLTLEITLFYSYLTYSSTIFIGPLVISGIHQSETSHSCSNVEGLIGIFIEMICEIYYEHHSIEWQCQSIGRRSNSLNYLKWSYVLRTQFFCFSNQKIPLLGDTFRNAISPTSNSSVMHL